MPICKKIYPNCIWIIPPDWHGLNIYSALLTKDYWNYGTDIIRVCVTAISTSTLKPDVNPKSNIQIRFGSKVIGSLNELLCHHSLNSTHLLLDELFSHLPTVFSSQIFDNFVYENAVYDPNYSDSNIYAFYSDDST